MTDSTVTSDYRYVLEMEKYNLYNLYICANSNIVRRLQAGGAVE